MRGEDHRSAGAVTEDRWDDLCRVWIKIGWAAYLHYGRGKHLQLPLNWVAVAMGYA